VVVFGNYFYGDQQLLVNRFEDYSGGSSRLMF